MRSIAKGASPPSSSATSRPRSPPASYAVRGRSRQWPTSCRAPGGASIRSCDGIGMGSDAFVRQLKEVSPIAGLGHLLAPAADLARRQPALPPGDFLQAGDLEPLTLFERLDEMRRFEQAVV